MNLKEQILFFKRLAFLCNAHIPLSEGLEVLSNQTVIRKQRSMLHAVLADVRAGQSLSRALGKYPKVFNGFSISLVAVGESSGTLATTLEYLADELKKKQILRSKVLGACMYPAVITIATLGITVFLILFLFPKITPIFKSLHAALPLSTRIVMSISGFLGQHGIWLLLGLALVATIAVAVLKRSRGARLLFDIAVLSTPLFGALMQSYSVSNSCRVLGLLLTNGISLPRAMLITAEATPSLAYRREFEAMHAAALRGERISSHMEIQTLFPPTLCHMVAVGERTGTLAQTLIYVADIYSNEVDDTTKNISTLIEPALMVFMGVLVGFIAISIITPIYAITQNLHG